MKVKSFEFKTDIHFINEGTQVTAQHNSLESALNHLMILYKIKHGNDALLEAIATNYEKLTQE